jgi:hypothetical protein
MRNQMKAIHAMRHSQASEGSRQSLEDHDAEMTFSHVEQAILEIGREVVTDRASSTTVSSPVTSTVSSNTTFTRPPSGTRRTVLRPSIPARDLAMRNVPLPSPLIVASPAPQVPARSPISNPPRVRHRQELTPRTEMPQQIAPAEESEVASPSSNDGDYIAVHEDMKELHLDPELNSEAAIGYINMNTRPVTAFLNEEFPQNIMSQQKATELGLDVDNLEEAEEGMVVDFGLGQQMVTGEVTFQWKKVQGQRSLGREKPLKIVCLVCESTPAPIIFGQRFLKKRRHYWNV